jgi:putative transposase
VPSWQKKENTQLSIRKQCEILNVARSGLDYVPVPEGERSHRLKRIMDELFLKDPCLGIRRLVEIFRRDYGEKVNRKML